MPVLKIEISLDQLDTLLKIAAREHRPTSWQAERLMWDAIEREAQAHGVIREPAATSVGDSSKLEGRDSHV